MIRIETHQTFPVPVNRAFAYITDMKHWPEYWPDFIRVQDPANAKWGQPGDEVTIVLKLLNRERALHMKLEQFQKDALVTYFSSQKGLPDTHHERHFKAVPEGIEYHIVVAFEPRPGLTGLADRFLVKRAIARAMRKTLENLDRIFRAQGKVS